MPPSARPSEGRLSLSPAQIEAIADRLVEALDERGLRPWGDVKTVARELGVQEEWVYENARKLGGVKLGPGRGARWRFEMARLRRLVASGVLEASGMIPAVAQSPGEDVNGSSNGSEHLAAQKWSEAQAVEPRRDDIPGFDDAPRPMARLDLSGRFTALNPAFSKLIGYAEEQFSKARWPSPHDREQFAEQLRALRSLAKGEVEEVGFRSSFLDGHGDVVGIQGRIRVARGEDGKPAHLLLTADDRPA